MNIFEYYPPLSFYFRVDFAYSKKKVPIPQHLGFSEVSGLEIEMETVTINEGGQNGYAHKLPGRVTYGDLTLKRGLRRLEIGSPVAAWCIQTLSQGLLGKNKLVLMDLVISVLDSNHVPVAVWSFFKAYPKKWSLGSLNSMEEGSILIEEMTLAYQYAARVK